VTVNGHKAREFTFTNPIQVDDPKQVLDFAGTCHIYRVGNRILDFSVGTVKSDLAANQAEFDKILNSVVITK